MIKKIAVLLCLLLTQIGATSGSFSKDIIIDKQHKSTSYNNMYEKYSKSVVVVVNWGNRLKKDDLGNFKIELTPIATGTGFFIDFSGKILTNNHVIEGADAITIITKDSNQFLIEDTYAPVKDADLAILIPQANADFKGYGFLSFGDSDKVRVGDVVFAIGHPMGYDYSFSMGNVSGAKRYSKTKKGLKVEYIQSEIAINPGNSGGPLLNADGKVIGINTAIITKSGMYSGISLSITSNFANKNNILFTNPILKYGN